jgi:dipeptidyl aminopeptidase/acylaminoacyl peptidase
VAFVRATRLSNPGETHPGFTEPKCVEAFVSTPVLVFHGRRGNRAPFADAERMVAALRQAGACATLVAEDEAGHDITTAETLKVHSNWVHSALGC